MEAFFQNEMKLLIIGLAISLVLLGVGITLLVRANYQVYQCFLKGNKIVYCYPIECNCILSH